MTTSTEITDPTQIIQSSECAADLTKKDTLYGFWATLGIMLLTIILVQIISIPLVFIFRGLDIPFDDKNTIMPLGLIMASSTLFSVWFWCRFKTGIVKYCKINMPTKRQILHSTITIVVFLGFTELLQYIFDKPNLTQWQIDLFAGASPAQLIYNFIGVVICAPLWEELLFRGFALTGWTKSLGSYTAVSLSAAIWAIIHIQYELFYVVLIFLFGLVIGSLRIRMKSLTVCIFIHMLNNLFSFFYTMYELDMFKEFGKLL